MITDIVVEPSKSEPGGWYWAFIVDGAPFADGDAPDRDSANWAARKARWDWEDRNRD